MTAIGIRYLTGSVVAASLSNRGRPEWPPHPGRVFMAITAAHFETGAQPEERPALDWLQDEPAPSICATEAFERSFVETYVPVNDKHAGIVKRPRQARSFPTARPVNDSVFFLWHANAPADVRAALEQLCSKVTRIGHSSSLVQMWVVDESQPLQATWTPDDFGNEQRMRIAPPGTLAYLEKSFNREEIEAYSQLNDELAISKGKARVKLSQELKKQYESAPVRTRPLLSTWQGYSRQSSNSPNETALNGPFEPRLIVLTPSETEGPKLGLESTLQLTGALRNAAMHALQPANPPEWLSGHQPDGSPTRHPHVAFFPLPFVSDFYADGHVMGLAIAIPRTLFLLPGQRREDTLRDVLGPLLFDDDGRERNIALWKKDQHGNDLWRWALKREMRERPPLTLRATTWTQASMLWASVTPVVLHHYPKRDGDVERIIREAFASALLPAPEQIAVEPVSQFKGAGHARSIPEFAEGGPNLCRYQAHVVARFSEPVFGPMLVGRGRFRGYGLFRPVKEEK